MADKPYKRPRSKSHRIWQGLLYVALVAFVFSIYQLYAHYSAEGKRAMEEGKRIVISLPDGSIEARPEKDQEKVEEAAEPEEKTEEHVEEKTDDQEAAEEKHEQHTEEPPAEENKEEKAEEKKEPVVTQEPKEPNADEKPADGAIKPREGNKAVGEGAIQERTDGEVPEGQIAAPKETAVAPKSESKEPAAQDAKPAPEAVAEAQPSTPVKGPRVAIIITGLGLSKATTEEAITLPANVTLAFSAYANRLQEWVQRSKGLGYSILLEVPMETADYPITDPGPLALLSKSTSGQNIDQLYTVLTQAQGFEGLIAAQNENFTFSRNLFEPVLNKIKDERLFFVYQQRPGNFHVADLANILKASTLPYTVLLDEEITEEAIDKKLTELESIANQKGYAVAVGRPYPLTVNAVRAWTEEASKRGITIVPAKNLINK